MITPDFPLASRTKNNAFRVVVSPVSSAPDGHNKDARRPPAKLSRVYAAPRRIRSYDKSLHRTERVSHRRERRPRFDRARSSHATSEMSLREGNEGFKTRIPRPAVVASPAPCAVEAPPARATAAAVKSAVAAAVRPVSDPIPQPPSMSPHPVPETPPRARARDPTRRPSPRASPTRIQPVARQWQGECPREQRRDGHQAQAHGAHRHDQRAPGCQKAKRRR